MNVIYLTENAKLPKEYRTYLINKVSEFMNINNRLPSKKDMLNNNVDIQQAITKYGGWKKTLKYLGIVADKDDIKGRLNSLKLTLGRLPILLDLKSNGIKINKVVEEFGNWNNAKKYLNGDNSIKTTSEVENEVINLTKKLNHIPTFNDLKENNIEYKLLFNRYNNWTNAKKELNLFSYVNKELLCNNTSGKCYTEKELEELKTKLINLQNKLNRKLLFSDLKNSDIELRKITRHFGCWHTAYKELDLNNALINHYKERVIEVSKELKRPITTKELKKYGINYSILCSKQKWKDLIEELDLDSIVEDDIKNKIIELSKELGYRPFKKELIANKINYKKVLKNYENISAMYDDLNIGEPVYTEMELNEYKYKMNLLEQLFNCIPTKELAETHKLPVNKIIRIYGTWHTFLIECGFIEGEPMLNEITQSIVDLSKELNHTPSLSELNSKNIKYRRLITKYGSYNKAMIAIGLDINRVISKSDEEYTINKIKELYKKLGHIPTKQELKANNIKYYKLLSECDDLISLYSKIGIKTDFTMTKDELLDKFHNIAIKLNKLPNKTEAKKEGINLKVINKKFNSWNDFIDEYSNKYINTAIDSYMELLKELTTELGKIPTIEEAREYGIDIKILTRNTKWKNICKSIESESIKESV